MVGLMVPKYGIIVMPRCNGPTRWAVARNVRLEIPMGNEPTKTQYKPTVSYSVSGHNSMWSDKIIFDLRNNANIRGIPIGLLIAVA